MNRCSGIAAVKDGVQLSWKALIGTLIRVVLTCCFTQTTYAQPGSPDLLYNELARARDSHGRVIHLFGDSIMRGYGTGVFADTMQESDKLYVLRSPASMINIIAKENALQIFAAYGGPIGLPENCADGAARIKQLSDVLVIRPGDIVVIEDAGDHNGNAKQYEACIRKLRAAVVRLKSVTLLLMTVFDATVERYSERGFPWHMKSFDIPFKGYSHNDAIIRAASTPQDKGRTLLIDINRILDRVRAYNLLLYDSDILMDDKIHLNVLGQLHLVCEILRAAGLYRDDLRLAGIEEVAIANAGKLGLTSPSLAQALIAQSSVIASRLGGIDDFGVLAALRVAAISNGLRKVHETQRSQTRVIKNIRNYVLVNTIATLLLLLFTGLLSVYTLIKTRRT